jgi:hypothetical protein
VIVYILEKASEIIPLEREIKCTSSTWSGKRRRSSRKKDFIYLIEKSLEKLFTKRT